MSSQVALNKSSPEPKANGASDLMLYSMRFCPFSQRLRVLLAEKEIPFSVYNIDLNSKPDWYATKNAGMTVPTLELDGKIVNDSIVMLEFLDATYPKPKKLLPDDPYARAQQRILIEHASKITVPYYGFMHANGDMDKIKASVKALDAGLEYFERKLKEKGTNYYAGNELGMIDVVLYPWFERFPMFTDKRVLFDATYQPVPEDRFPLLNQWHKRMLESKGVKATVQSLDTHCNFVELLIKGTPNYDYGLEDV